MDEPDLEIDAGATAMAHDQMPFAKELGLEVISARADEVRARADWSPLRCTTAGMLHGGFLFAGVPHARIRRLDTSKARAIPGVFAVITADDVP